MTESDGLGRQEKLYIQCSEEACLCGEHYGSREQKGNNDNPNNNDYKY